MQLGLWLNLPAVKARRLREGWQAEGVRIPGPALLEMLLAEGVPAAEAAEEVARVLAARALADIEGGGNGRQ